MFDAARVGEPLTVSPLAMTKHHSRLQAAISALRPTLRWALHPAAPRQDRVCARAGVRGLFPLPLPNATPFQLARNGTVGARVENSSLPLWTLSLRLRGDVLECSLGDGHRLAWRADRPAVVLQARPLGSLAELIGDELAGRPVNSEPRPLALLYDGQGPVDDIDWYLVFADFKIAVILEGIHARHLQGHTEGDDFAGVGAMVDPLLDRALERASRSAVAALAR